MSRIRADKFVNRAASGAPELTYGAQVVTGYGITGAGGINITGVATATSFSGSGANLTGIAATANVVTNSLVSSGIVTVSNTTDSTSSTTGALIVSGGVGIAKSLFVGNNVTIGGTVTYEDVTNVDSVGIITAQTGIIVTAGGIDITAGGLEVSAGIATFKGVGNFDAEVTAAGGVDVTGGVKVGAALTVVGALDVDGATTLDVVTTAEEVKVGSAITISTAGITTISKPVHFEDGLSEQVVIVANKLSAATNIDCEQGNVWYFSTNETTTATPNLRWNGSVEFNDGIEIGQTYSVSIIYKPNNAGYYAALNIDGSGVTEEWLGGSAPSSANSGGYDILTHQILKIGDGSFICLSNVQNYA